MSDNTNTTLAIMAGELRRITVETADGSDGPVAYAAPGEMVARTVSALRMAYPAARIVETGSASGAVIHGIQTLQDLAALQANHA